MDGEDVIINVIEGNHVFDDVEVVLLLLSSSVATDDDTVYALIAA